MHTRNALAALLTCALTASCTAAYDASNDTVGSSEEAATARGWHYFIDCQGTDLDLATSNMSIQGYRPISISAWGSTDAPRFAAVFVKRSGPSFHVLHDTGTASWQNAFNREVAAGYKPALLSFDGDASNPVWAAVFVATSTGVPTTRHGLVSGSHRDSGTIEYWLDIAHANNLIPSALSIYGNASSPAYAIVLEPNSSNIRWSVGQSGWSGDLAYAVSETHDEYQARWDAQTPAGNRPGVVDLNGDERYVSVYRDDSVGPFVGAHGYTLADANAIIDAQRRRGLYPISIQGGGSANGARFALLFAQTDLPLAKRWTATGSGAASDTSISDIDNVLYQFMRAHDVRQASLAVLNGTRLAYARGYSYEEPGLATTNPTTTFRLASVSKIVTAMEIMHLVDRGQIRLTDRAQDILNLQTYTGAAPAPLFGTITVQHLLQHDYPTLTVNGVTKCLKRDADAGWNAASVLGVSLPLTREQAISVSLAASDLVTRDWSPNEGCYSNFSYILLGQIVEAMTGASYLTAVVNDLFAPLSMMHAHGAVADVHAQPANEATYCAADLLTNPSIDVAGSPLTANPYGVDNFDVGEAAGGLSIAAPEVARLLSVLNIGAGNPIYANDVTTARGMSTVDQILRNRFGFDQTPTDAYGVVHYVKGGEITGTQTTASFVRGGVGYVLLWARDGLDGLGGDGNWWPTWNALETAIHDASITARPDLFPAYGMRSL